jgi:hypothetical protein
MVSAATRDNGHIHVASKIPVGDSRSSPIQGGRIEAEGHRQRRSGGNLGASTRIHGKK